MILTKVKKKKKSNAYRILTYSYHLDVHMKYFATTPYYLLEIHMECMYEATKKKKIMLHATNKAHVSANTNCQCSSFYTKFWSLLPPSEP